jgi:4-hydroxybenzoate polyprenyltransferase
MVLLTKINIQTDFYAGVLIFTLIISLEKYRKQQQKQQKLPIGISFSLALLLVGAWHIKETAILPMFAYVMVVLYDDFKNVLNLLQYFIWFTIATIFFIFVECMFMYLEFNEFTYKFTHSWSLPHGNGIEYANAVKSSRFSLYVFHIVEHLKAISSQGIGGILSLFGAVYFFKKHWVARFFIAAILLMCLLGLGGNFTLARYWFLFYPADVALMYLLWTESHKLPKYQYIRAVCVLAGISITVLNYWYRYYGI